MKIKSSGAEKIYLAIGATIGWFAVVSQFYLQIIHRVTPVPEAIVRFFSYFTILTNLLIDITFTILLLNPVSVWGKYFSQPRIRTAIAVYISFVGIIYNTILRQLWSPQGLQLVVDLLLHSCMPVIFVLYWLIFVPKNELKWKNVLPWMIYPIAYSLIILMVGTFSGFYPYPFFNVNELGYAHILLNDIRLIIAFMLLSLLFVALAKAITRISR
jgi:hypothetical protein